MSQSISGKELAITKEANHIVRVQSLKLKGVIPKLAILQTIPSPVIDMYIRVKKAYAEKIGVHVEHYHIEPGEIEQIIEKLNNDNSIHGIIIQLPLHERIDQEKILNLVTKSKDVDGLALGSNFVPPTVQSIIWLIGEYIPHIFGKKVALVGKGRLVGAPLEKELFKMGIVPTIFTKEDSLETLLDFDIIISATGTPSLLKNQNIKNGTFVIDAGTAEENGSIHGDACDELYQREDISITPTKGGVGILTVRALFENIMQAAEES